MLRLDFVSPLPPTRTGIADYSADLLPYLAPRCDLRLVRLPGQAVDDALTARWPPVAASALGGERLPLYQMGNNRLHLPVWEAALRVPGVLVLHDLVLHHFLLGRTVGSHDWEGYRRQLAIDEGWVGAAAAQATRWGLFSNTLQFALPARRSLLRSQRGVLVHSSWAADELREEDAELRVIAVPMPIPLPALAEAGAGEALRSRLGIPAKAPVLGSFGFQTPMKRTDLAVRALAEPALASVHLIVAGEESPYTDLAGLAAKLGVAERVHCLGYVPFDTLERAIAASDLCLNLRYPTAGETSASLLRILAVGRPAVVNEYGQFRDLAAGVVKVSLGGDPGDATALAAELAGLLGSRDALQRLGGDARAHIARDHDPARAAAAMIAACGEFERLEPPGSAPPRVPAPSPLTSQPMGGELLVESLAGWQPGERREIRLRLRNSGGTRWLATDRGYGGLALWVELSADGAPVSERLPWLEVPRDLAPGDEQVFALMLRKPLGQTVLKVVPRLQGMGDAHRFGGPVFEGIV